MVRSPLVIALASVCATAGCGNGAGQAASAYDENRYTGAPAAEIRIGQGDGPAEYLFDQVHGVALYVRSLVVTDRSGTIRSFVPPGYGPAQSDGMGGDRASTTRPLSWAFAVTVD